jgi:membrane-associated phospholipid phosphatase
MRTTRSIRQLISAAALLSAAAGPALAQGGNAVPATGQPDSGTIKRHKHLFNRRDLVVAGAFTGTTILLFPLDRRLAQDLQDSSIQANHFFRSASNRVEFIASPGAYYIGGVMYLVGRASGNRRVADLGFHGTEAVLLGEVTSYILKGVLGRGRPYVSNSTVPTDFDLGRGFKSKDWRSFPSGHTTTAFAAAAAVTDETTLWWPRSTWIVGPLMYGGATLVGLSRMYHSRHWASDVAVGALIGTFSGKKVVLASHSNPNNAIDRVMLGTFVAPSQYGTLNVGWAKKW